jgi:geranylgeranyl diphosphate synthase type I
MDALESCFSRYLPSIELEMRAVVQAHDPGQGDLFGLLRYHLGWVDASFQPCDARSGKRIRPILCLLACEGCGGAWERVLPAAAAIELLHNFSLIHDDIEDQDQTRRGRPTVWSIWGEAQGINAGDTLFSVSQLAMLRLQERGVPDATVVRAARLFSETCVDLTAGQYLDIGFESRDDVSVDNYLTMIEGKTAALVACSCELGALLAPAPTAQREALRAFGYHSGLAFQMLDDILGIWGESDVTGKPVGADIARQKKTLPLLHGLERSPDLRALLARQPLSDAEVQEATHLLEAAGSREYTEQLAREHYDLALGALEQAALRERTAKALRQLARKLLNRRR